MWAEPDVIRLFSINVGSFSLNVVRSAPIFSANVVPKNGCNQVGAFMLSGRNNYGSIEHGYKKLCSLCLNAEVAKQCGLEEFENIRLEPIGITDSTGQTREFHFVTRLMGDILSLNAFELQDGIPAGYQFQVLGDPEDDIFALLGRMVEKIRRALAVKNLVDDPKFGPQIAQQLVCGNIESDPACDERTPLLVIDGKEVTWEEFGQILMTFEGSQFKLELFDPSDEA